MKKILIFICLCFFAYSGSAKQWLVFIASKQNLSAGSLAGHAFISFIKENTATKQTVVIGSWGFYPKSGGGYFTYVDGTIRNDIARAKDVSIMIEVDDEEFDNALFIKSRWETKNYKLTAQNCLDFVKEVAESITILKIPEPTLANKWPSSFLSALKSLNSNIEVYSTPGTPAPDKNLLTAGTAFLFTKNDDYGNYFGTELTPQDKEAIFKKTDLKYSEVKKNLFLADDLKFSYPISTGVTIIDLDKDGFADVLISLYNMSYFGQAGKQLVLRNNGQGDFVKIADVDGSCEIMTIGKNGFPDLLVGGPGLTAPVLRWNGNQYKFYRTVPFEQGNAPKTYTFKEYAALAKQ